jgi:hypothetical protein
VSGLNCSAGHGDAPVASDRFRLPE